MHRQTQNRTTASKHIPLAQVLKLAGVSGFGNIVQQCIRMVTNIIITRTIGASAYGLFSLGMTVVNMGAIIPRFGLPRSITRFVAYYRGKGEAEKVPLVLRQALLISLCLGTATAILIYLLAPYLASAVFHNEALSPVLRWLSLFIPFGISGMVLLGTLQGLKQIEKQVMIQDFLWPMVRLALVVLFFLIGWRLYGLVTAVVLAVVVRFAVSFVVVGGQVSLRKPGHVQLPINKLLFFSAPLLLVNALGFALNWTDTLMLGYFREPAEVGVYAIAWRLSLFVSFPLAAFATIFNPMAAEYVGKGDDATLQTFLQTTNHWILLFSLPLSILLFSFPGEVMSIFGKEFTAGAWVVLFLVAGQLVSAASGPCGNVLMVKGWTGLNLINTASMAIVNIILNLVMIPRWGMLGAALATSFSLALVNILRVVEVRFFLKITPYTLGYLKPLFCGIIASVPIFLFKESLPIIALLCFIIIYLILVFILDRQSITAFNVLQK